LLYSILSYFKFLIRSKNEHGIHSPFVYDFTTKCLYKKNTDSKPQLKILKAFQKDLLSNKNLITVTDFGAGSRVFKTNHRIISAIAKNAGISNKRAKLLFKITQYFKPEHILEIGTSLGISTACMHLGNPKTKITTLEGCKETAKIAKEQFEKFNFREIKIQIGEFKNTLSETLKNNNFDLIYFDGNHQEESTINYFLECLKYANNNSIFIFDDIHWNEGMCRAWEFIKNNEKVTISIDTFQWGLVFFRAEQRKEHFNIRI
jgi:predicted O-methyltransferase YrrM